MMSFMGVAIAAVANDGIDWLGVLSVGGPVMAAAGLLGGVVKWWFELRGKRSSTQLVNAQSDQLIVDTTKDLIGVVRSELTGMRAEVVTLRAEKAVALAERDAERQHNAKLTAALMAAGITVPPREGEVIV